MTKLGAAFTYRFQSLASSSSLLLSVTVATLPASIQTPMMQIFPAFGIASSFLATSRWPLPALLIVLYSCLERETYLCRLAFCIIRLCFLPIVITFPGSGISEFEDHDDHNDATTTAAVVAKAATPPRPHYSKNKTTTMGGNWATRRRR